VKFNIGYFLLMGVLIVMLNNDNVNSSINFLTSLIVLIVEIVYIVILIVIKPYQFCIKIHSIALYINHLCLVVLFIFINIFSMF